MSGEPAPSQPNTPVAPPGGTPLPAPAAPPVQPPSAPSTPAGAAPTMGTPGTAPAAAQPPPGAGTPTTPAAPAPWPEKFLRDGKPDAEVLLNSYRELERKQFQRREDLKVELRKEVEAAQVEGVPAAPADYTYTPMKLKDGRELELNTQDPVFQFFATTAHDLKIPQSKFQGLVEQFALAQLASGPSWEKESAALGEQAEVRLTRASMWGKGRLSQQAYDTFARMPATKANIEMWEEIMELTGEPKFAISQAGTVKETLTMDDVKAMMNDPKYWDSSKRDPQHVARVRAALRRINGR